MHKNNNIFFNIILIICVGIIYFYKESIAKYIVQTYSTYNVYETSNIYTKNKNYLNFKRTDDFTPINKEELVNVIYTILDDGIDNFTFYCDYHCEDDIKEISNGQILGLINNYIHPYNSYDTINITINNYDIVNISILKNYSEYEIEKINAKMLEIINETITSNMNDYEKIKAFHDYIVNNTIYDEKEAALIENNERENLTSHKAYNVFINGIGVCGGYTDALAIFLNYIGIDNFKVSTEDHIWNVLYLDKKWQHVDVTWDDPVANNDINILIHDYFMISTEDLISKNLEKHSFNRNLYLELN